MTAVPRLRASLAALLLVAGCTTSELPPKLYPAPDAALVTDAGRRIRLSELRGKAVVYDFIFTRCQGPCPLMSQQMKKLVARLDDGKLRFVSISADPEFDTPPVLAAYARKYRDDPRWLFLTGSRESIHHVSIDGFKLAVSEAVDRSQPVVHSTKFVLVDPDGMVRGYYDAFSPEGRESLARDARAVLAGN